MRTPPREKPRLPQMPEKIQKEKIIALKTHEENLGGCLEQSSTFVLLAMHCFTIE
jgi:hypothetical protein